MNNKENRFFQNADLKIETREDGKKLRITGHAAVFDIPTEIGWWLEEWAPGSFSRTISDGDIRALFNHDPNFPLGRNTNGSLELSEDQKGLYFEVVPPDTQWARDLLISIDRGGAKRRWMGKLLYVEGY
jgi:HK97 family phage prohead protease